MSSSKLQSSPAPSCSVRRDPASTLTCGHAGLTHPVCVNLWCAGASLTTLVVVLFLIVDLTALASVEAGSLWRTAVCVRQGCYWLFVVVQWLIWAAFCGMPKREIASPELRRSVVEGLPETAPTRGRRSSPSQSLAPMASSPTSRASWAALGDQPRRTLLRHADALFTVSGLLCAFIFAWSDDRLMTVPRSLAGRPRPSLHPRSF